MQGTGRLSGLLLISILMLSVAGTSQQVPATYFGMHTIDPQNHWPSVPIGAMRPANVSWAAINTANGVYNWTTLDAWVAATQSHQVELNYLLLNVPQWASSSPTQSCYRGNYGCAAPPSDFQTGVGSTYWANFVSALVTRYRGKISSYELWNEPNATAYWTGTTSQLVDMARQAYTIIKAIDPAAKVLSPAPTWTSTTAWVWMDSYLTAGGGTYADVIAYHGYTGNNKSESVLTIVDNMKAVMAQHGITSPAWITEGGWGTNNYVPDADAQAAFLAQRYLLIWPRGPQRFYWYQWDNPNWGTLWDSTTGMHKAGIAYQQVYNWMIGASAAPCVKAGDSTWTCGITRSNGYQGEAVWNTTATVTLVAPSQFTRYRDVSGNTYPLASGGTVTVGTLPILMETGDPTTAPFLTLQVSPLSGTAPVMVAAAITANPSGYALTSPTLLLGDGTVVNGAATTHTYTNPGTYTVTGTTTDLNGNLMSARATVTVAAASAPADFTASATPTSLALGRGQSGTVNFTVMATGGFNQPVTLACGNLPPGVSCSFATNAVNPAGSAATSTLTISVAGPKQSASLKHRAPWLAMLLAPGLVLLGNINKRKLLLKIAAMALIGLLVIASGCSGVPLSNTSTSNGAMSSPNAVSNTSTASAAVSSSLNGIKQATSYTLVISVTSGALQHTVPIYLTVQ